MLAQLAGREPAEVRTEMHSNPDKVRDQAALELSVLAPPKPKLTLRMWRTQVRMFCSKMFGEVSKAQTGKKLRRTHGAGRLLNWEELAVSHTGVLRQFAQELHTACVAGEDSSTLGGGLAPAPAATPPPLQPALQPIPPLTACPATSPGPVRRRPGRRCELHQRGARGTGLRGRRWCSEHVPAPRRAQGGPQVQKG